MFSKALVIRKKRLVIMLQCDMKDERNQMNRSIKDRTRMFCEFCQLKAFFRALKMIYTLFFVCFKFSQSLGQLYCYSHNPERQAGKPLLPVLNTLVCRGDNLPLTRPLRLLGMIGKIGC